MAPIMPALGLGADGRMTIVEAPVPTPRSGQILVEVKVSAVNEMDVQVRAGGWRSQVRRFRQAGPVLTGFEFVGVARSDGARILVGQRVIGYVHVLNGRRTHAQFVCVDENDLAPIPEGLDDEAGAALVVMGLTAVEVLERLKPLRPGAHCLVIGAAGGVGTYVTQLARFQGATVTAVCSQANAAWVTDQGASDIRPYETAAMFSHGDQFDLILDAPAKSSFAETAPYLANDGMYVSTNPMADVGGFVRAMASSRRAGYLMMLTTTPSKLGRLIDLWAEGGLRPVVDSVHALSEADAAFDRFGTRGKQGRVLLRISA